MKITTQLYLGFGLILILLCMVAAVATVQVRSVKADLQQINETNSVKQRYAINFRGSVHDRAIALRDIVLADAAELPAITTDIAELTAKYDKSAGPLDAMLAPNTQPMPQETAILAAIKTTETQTLPLIQNVMALRRAGNAAGAQALLMTKAKPQFVLWLKQINQFIDLQEANNKAVGATVHQKIGRFEVTMSVLCLVALFLSALIARWSMAGLRLLPQMVAAIRRMTEGDRSAAVPVVATRSEIGDLARAMQSFRDQLAAADAEKDQQTALICNSIGASLAALSAGDLTTRVDADLVGPFAKLKSDFNHALDTFGGVIGSVSVTAASIHDNVGDIANASDDLSRRTEQQAASLEETAAAMSEITSTVRKTAEDAGHVQSVVSQARSEAENGGEIVRNAVGAMTAIEHASSEISEIIAVIDGIAFQTNLLALNAGVEAARAGDAGKGFAVVASEVRALAQRAADAAKDVKSRILMSSEQVGTGVGLVNQTGRALNSIIGRISEIDTLVSTIAQSADRQAAGLQEVNTAVSEMDGVTQQNAAMVEEATAAARALSGQAQDLAKHVARFRVADGAPAAAAATVHQLKSRAANAGQRAARAGSRRTANAVRVDDDWSAF